VASLFRKGLLVLAACLPFTLNAEPAQRLEPGTMAARVAACVHCHGADGRAGPDGFYPRIAGKPAGYLYTQLVLFRDGGRSYDPMRHLLEGLSDEYLNDIAQHFADMRLPYAPPARPSAPAAVLETGRMLAETGKAAQGVPACAACHGSAFTGMEPHIPGLLGLSRDYIASQLGSWRTGLRHAAEPDCMAQVVQQLTAEEIGAISAWLASQPVAEPYTPLPAGALSLPIECGSISQPDDVATPEPAGASSAPEERIELGRYLAVAANCAGCHTTAGGKPFAGGTAIATDLGTLYGPNITPSDEHGIGEWSADDFFNALHHGRKPDGTPLYPAFPYPQYTLMTREDSDAIYAYLTSLPAVDTPSLSHDLRFPYNQRTLLPLWRSLYFEPGTLEPDPTQTTQWNRGRYLVEGVGHCAACHTPRNRWAANDLKRSFHGAGMIDAHWYATPLTGNAAGLGDWSTEDIVQLLRTGMSRHGTAEGAMAEVVSHSTQFLSENDLGAMAEYLKSLPPGPRPAATEAPPEDTMLLGNKLYQQHCVACHGASGEGSPPAWPALAGNASVRAEPANNVVLSLLRGGYAPTTQANPQPHGMPPYHGLSDSDIAALATYVRNSWGNTASPVRSHEVSPLR